MAKVVIDRSLWKSSQNIGNDREALIKGYLANVDRMDNKKAEELTRKV
jgi:hypothetical protein